MFRSEVGTTKSGPTSRSEGGVRRSNVFACRALRPLEFCTCAIYTRYTRPKWSLSAREVAHRVSRSSCSGSRNAATIDAPTAVLDGSLSNTCGARRLLCIEPVHLEGQYLAASTELLPKNCWRGSMESSTPWGMVETCCSASPVGMWSSSAHLRQSDRDRRPLGAKRGCALGTHFSLN